MDTENEINKIRWERWRAKQKTEREKTCFYCWEQWNQWHNWDNWNQWNNWNNWSDVPYDEPEWTLEGKKSAPDCMGLYTAYKATSIGYFRGVWVTGPPAWGGKAWQTTFRVGETAATRSYPENNPVHHCAVQILEIEEYENKPNQAIWATNDPVYVASWPKDSGPVKDYYEVAYAVISLAVGLINTYAGVALSALTIIDEFLGVVTSFENNPELKHYEWDYTREPHPMYPSECSHFCWWRVDIAPDQTITFKVKEYLIYVGTCVDELGDIFSVTITSPPAPEGMSAAEMKKYDIEAVPINKIEERAAELLIPPETVKKLLKQGEPVYIAHKMHITGVQLPYEPPSFLSKKFKKLLGIEDK